MSGGRRRTGLSPEDRALWERVRRSARPLGPKAPAADESESFDSKPKKREPGRTGARAATMPARPAPRMRASFTLESPRPTLPAAAGRGEPGLDRRTAERLSRGERAPDARLDLHGMTAARAHARLDRFIADALARGHRMVLVITGKGGRRPHAEDAPFLRPGEGVLRQAVPGWLRAGPHRDRVVGVFTAHPRHGGEGALYVYLKKRR